MATSWLQRAKITPAGYSQGRTKYLYQFSQKIVFNVLIYVRAYRRVLNLNLEYIEMNEINNAKKADKILQSVCASFKRIPIRNPEVLNRNNHRLTFNVNLEIQEEENSKFIPVPFDKNSFKLRRNFNKKVAVSVTQSTGLVLPVERLGT